MFTQDNPQDAVRGRLSGVNDSMSESGDDGGGVTPVPIPNTEVKSSSVDGTWRVAAWESRTLLV